MTDLMTYSKSTVQTALLTVAFVLVALSASLAQVDTTVYNVVEEMPRFPGCEHPDSSLQARQRCAQERLLAYTYRRALYPEEARQQGVEGTAVVAFTIEKDGSVTDPRVVRDPGATLGVAALQVALLMQQEGVVWVPGKQRGQAVRTRFNLPVKFKLEEPKPYVLSGADTIYTQFEQPLNFTGGAEALQAYLDRSLTYPVSGNDSCRVGQIDLRIVVRPDSLVDILDMTDYNDLGFDFWYEAIHSVVATGQRWQPAVYEGRQVTSAIDLTVSFLPSVSSCKTTVERYLAAVNTANEGIEKLEAAGAEGDRAPGLALLTSALEEFPRDGRFLVLRGQAYLDNNQLSEACTDLSLARRIALIDWFDSVLPLICR